MDHEGAVREARELYDAGEGRRGTDEDKFTEVIGTRSFAQLRATFEEYAKVWRGVVREVEVWSRRWVCLPLLADILACTGHPCV